MVRFSIGKALFSAAGIAGISFSVIYLNKKAFEVIKCLLLAPFDEEEDYETPVYGQETDDEENYETDEKGVKKLMKTLTRFLKKLMK